MTLVLCLNYGDKIYVAADSLMTVPRSDGGLRPVGYRLKLYAVPNCNAIVAFSGTMVTARQVLRRIAQNAVNETPSEEDLFARLPAIITSAIGQLRIDQQQNIDILFASLIPNSQAYQQEKFPGIGVPPRTACGVFSWRKDEDDQLITEEGRAIHVPSGSGTKFVATDPRTLMDIFITGSGADEIVPSDRYYHYYYGFRDNPTEFVMQIMGKALNEFFEEIPIELSGVGGEYQVACLTEQGIEMRISTADDPFKPVKVEFKHDAYLVTDLNTGSGEVIQTVWDDRYPYEIKEMGYLL